MSNSTATASRIRLFTPDPTSIAAAVSIAADAPIEQTQVTRREGQEVTAQMVTVGGTVIEVRVADLDAAITNSVAAGFPISVSRTGAARITLGDIVISMREAR